jgi:pilus assembly protein CpaC
MRINVSPEISDLDFANGTIINGGRVPAFTKRTAHTTVELADGQSFALAGLLNNKINATVDAIPLLGDIPVLGVLFKSTKYQRSETELVIMVTPRIVAPLNPDQVPVLPGQHWRYPTNLQLYLGNDLGGPEVEPGVASADKGGKKTVASAAGAAPTGAKTGTNGAPAAPSAPPPQFKGAYGYNTPDAASGTVATTGNK